MNIEKRSEGHLNVIDAMQRVEKLMAEWQTQLPEVQVVLGGSLVSGTFVYDEHTKTIDVDVRFLTKTPITNELQEKVERVTGLKYRKIIQVSDWPDGMSEGRMVEGELRVPKVSLPLEVEGCIRNDKYVGWARFYKDVLSPDELARYLEQKRAFRNDKAAYNKLKQDILAIVKERAVAKGLV